MFQTWTRILQDDKLSDFFSVVTHFTYNEPDFNDLLQSPCWYGTYIK